MYKWILYGLQIYCIVIYFALYCNADGVMKQPKRISNQQRLLPFPRIGRGGDAGWNLDRPGNSRISSLIAVPRVGKSDPNFFDMSKQGSSSKNMNTGLWFGPRLGRVNKRNVYMYDIPNDYYQDILYPAEFTETRQLHYTPRLGREEDEQQQLQQQQQQLVGDEEQSLDNV